MGALIAAHLSWNWFFHLLRLSGYQEVNNGAETLEFSYCLASAEVGK